MTSKIDFYSEIFIKEQKWIELINSGLINVIYCKFTLKPFYEKKKNDINKKINNSDNKILEQILNIIDEIIVKLDSFEANYKNMKDVNIRELIPLFLVNQMGNNMLNNESSINVDSISYKKL